MPNMASHVIPKSASFHAERLDPSTWPPVAVVIPTYNCASTIGAALDSVLIQNYPELHVLVVDDGSTDDTCTEVARYGRYVTLIKKPNGGAAAARNEAMKRAMGEYIAFLDGDDIWFPQKLRHQIAHLERYPDIGLCCSKWDLLAPNAAPPSTTPDELEELSAPLDTHCSGWIYRQLLQSCEVWTSTVVMRNHLKHRIGGFDETLRRGQDYDYWLRASRVTKIHRLNLPLAWYRTGSNHDRRFLETNWELLVIKSALERWGTESPDGISVPKGEIRRRLWQLNFDFAYEQLKAGRHAQARAGFVSSLIHRPLHMRTALYALASLAGALITTTNNLLSKT